MQAVIFQTQLDNTSAFTSSIATSDINLNALEVSIQDGSLFKLGNSTNYS
jgi:hypothetical protein